MDCRIDPHYTWSYATSVRRSGESAGAPTGEMTAEWWLRDTWETTPRPLRQVLTFAWRYGLGLRLGSVHDPTRVLGWHIADATPNRLTVDADSKNLHAENILRVADGTLQWQTIVNYNNVVGRLLWMPARIVHQWLVPRLLRRSVRRASTQ